MGTTARPTWLVEALDVSERRTVLLRSVVAGVVVLGVLLAIAAPGLLPPTPLVGAAVALAAILLGIAVVLAVDAGDAVVRGPRHVRTVGGELVGVLPTTVSAEGAEPLAEAVLAVRAGRRLTLGLAGTAPEVPIPAWAEALATAIARNDASVLVVDLASGATPEDGILEVVRDGRPLARAVSFETDIKLARIGAGRDLDEAIRATASLPSHLPKDLEVLLVALPPLAGGNVLGAAASLDAVLIVARTDATRQVRLQAAIEGVEATGTTAQVVLVDDRLAPSPAVARETQTVADEEDTDDSERQPATGHQSEAPPVAPERDVRTAVQREAGEPETHQPEVDEAAPADPVDGDGASVDEPDGPSAEGPPDAAVPYPLVPPRADLGRRPGPSVRVVRDLPPMRPRRDVTPSGEAEAVEAVEAEAIEPADPAAVPPPVERDAWDEDEPDPPPAVSRRDPDVLAGAAAAALAAELEAVPSIASVPEPEPALEPEPAPEPAPEPEPLEEVATEPIGPGPTDQVPRGASDDDEDPLRTTAQLALLMEELHDREPPSA